MLGGAPSAGAIDRNCGPAPTRRIVVVACARLNRHAEQVPIEIHGPPGVRHRQAEVIQRAHANRWSRLRHDERQRGHRSASAGNDNSSWRRVMTDMSDLRYATFYCLSYNGFAYATNTSSAPRPDPDRSRRRRPPAGARAPRDGRGHGSDRRRRRRLGAAKGRQRGRRRGRGRLRDGGDASVRRQHRRRRLHADSHGRRPDDVHRFPRARAGEVDAQHVPGREGRAHARQHRGLAIVGRAGHRSRIRARGRRSTASGRGPRTWRRPWSSRRRASRCPTRSPKGFKGSKSLRELAGVEAHLPEERRVLRGRRNADAARTGADARSASRRTAPSEFYEGETAKRFAAEMAKHGGIITLDGSEELQGDRAHAAVRHLPRLHDHHRAAVQLRRHRPARDARASSTAPATRRAAPARRRAFTTWRRRCAAPTPTATNTSAIRTS